MIADEAVAFLLGGIGTGGCLDMVALGLTMVERQMRSPMRKAHPVPL